MTDQQPAADEAADELEAIASTRVRTVPLLGDQVEVRPLTIGQLPEFARAVRPLTDDFNRLLKRKTFDAEQILTLIENKADDLRSAVAVAVRRDPDDLAHAEIDQFTELAVAIFAVNADFFVKRLLPNLAKDVNVLVEVLKRLPGSGRTRSKS